MSGVHEIGPIARERAGLRTLLILAWPVVISRAAQAVIGFCDTLMVAPLGESALAATTAGAMNVFLAAILPMGTVFIVQSFAAQFHGRGEAAAARRYAHYGLLFSAFVGLLGLALQPAVGPLVGLLPHTEGVKAEMADYIVVRLWGLFAIVGVEALGNYYAGLGRTGVHMRANVIAMVSNVALNWLLIEGHLGAPALGVRGAALASAAASWLALFWLLGRFARERAGRDDRGLDRRELIRMLRFGFPNGINWFLEFAAFTYFLDFVVADLGTVALAAFMVVLNLNSVSFMPAFGLASAGAILCGQSIGAGQRDEVPRLVKITAGVAATWQCTIGLFYLLLPALFVRPFVPPTAAAAEFTAVAVTMLRLSATWQLFDAMAMVLAEALRSAGDTAWPMWARVVLGWVLFVPLSHLTVHTWGFGTVAAISSMVVYLGALAGLLWYRFRGGAWRKIELTEPVL